MTQVLAIGTPAASARPVGRGVLKGLVRRLARLALLVVGGFLVLLGILIAPLPGPFGLPVSVVGMVVILRNSYWAKRQFIRAQHARPKVFYPFRRLMRRRPEFAPVLWQQALRMERLLLKRGRRVLSRTRRAFRASFRRSVTA
ncbi:MAG: hypothetical protein ACK4FB_11880 [Brevundimonas sp.]|uniref:hypothetical protein n=1 Tax=Brevundimonas sp. TaxID=1871086 RepID=UPI00391AC333